MIEQIVYGEQVIAIIIRHTFDRPGVTFVTPDNYSQQLAFMKHPQGVVIQAHIHNPVQREVIQTRETLMIKKGVLRVDLYTDEKQYLESRLLYAGDVILLAGGGHGFEVVEAIEMIEVKQGPYAGNNDKTCFAGVSVNDIHMPKGDDQ